MENVVTTVRWLQRGRQRSAVVLALHKPMTSSEICAAARRINPRVQLRDVWFIIRQLMQRKFVHCLNPRRTNGQLFYLTDQGRDAVAAAFGRRCDPLPQNVNWRKYGDVVRGNTPRLVLEGLGRLGKRTCGSQTAAAARKFLRNGNPRRLTSAITAPPGPQTSGVARRGRLAVKTGGAI